jgi:hydrogenase maturation protease
MKTLVIGLGNPALTDDGAGIYAAQAVRKALPTEADVDVIELSVGGLALMEAMSGYRRVILLDALWAPEDQVGQVVQFDAGCLPATLNTASTHDVDLPTALHVGRRLGVPLPLDEDIHIVAITAHEVLTFGEKPTPPVNAAVPEAAARVLALLGYTDVMIPEYAGGNIDDLP